MNGPMKLSPRYVNDKDLYLQPNGPPDEGSFVRAVYLAADVALALASDIDAREQAGGINEDAAWELCDQSRFSTRESFGIAYRLGRAAASRSVEIGWKKVWSDLLVTIDCVPERYIRDEIERLVALHTKGRG